MPPVIRPIAVDVALAKAADPQSVLARVADDLGSISLIRHFRIPVRVEGRRTIVIDVPSGKVDEGAVEEVAHEVDAAMRRLHEAYPIESYTVRS